MSCHPRVTEWTATIQTHLPHLTQPQATVLALWTLGMVLARSCALTAVRGFLAAWLSRKEQTVRQQLRAFCYAATAKRGRTRCALDVATCFVPVLVWGVTLWQGTHVALALDATTVGTRLTVLAISGVYRGCAIPVIGTILPATAKHAWRREWLRMRRQVHRAVPRAWTVIVLADRGLYARWLFRRLTRVVSANLLHGFGQFNLRKPRRRERYVGRKWWKARKLPRMPRAGISVFLTISTNIPSTYALTFVCCFPLWPS